MPPKKNIVVKFEDAENIKINNEEDLKKHFHRIHDYLRDMFGLYGKTALQFFNFFFVLKMIGDLVDNCNNDNNDNKIFNGELSYSKFRNLVNKSYKFTFEILTFLEAIKKEIKENEILEKSIFMTFPNDIFDRFQENDKGRGDGIRFLQKFLCYIDILDKKIIDEYHVGGRIYEYFLGFLTAKNKGKRGGSQMEDLGQFFTSRIVVRFIITLLNPELD